MSVLLDAGPSLNFLAVRQENVLSQAAASANLGLAVPARVEKEILGVCRDAKHAAGQNGWIKHGLTWQAVYQQMRQFDDGLPDLGTRLA